MAEARRGGEGEEGERGVMLTFSFSLPFQPMGTVLPTLRQGKPLLS